MTIKSILLRNTAIEQVADEPLFAERPDLQLIFDLIPNEKSVLDLGCGDGALLEALVREKKTKGRGIESFEHHGARVSVDADLAVLVDDGFTRR